MYRSEREGGAVITGDQIDEETFEVFYARWREPLRRAVAMATGDVSTAAEAVDEAMTRALARWDRIEGYEMPEGWVYRVAVNWSRGVFRKQSRELLTAIDADSTRVDRLPDVDLISAVERLPRRSRVVVIARYYLDWSTSEVAHALEVAEGTVKSRLSRALDQLARELGEER